MSEWTVETLREHFLSLLKESQLANEQRFNDQTRAVDAALAAAEKAVEAALASAERATLKAEMAYNERFASVNEFRSQLTDQAATFITRHEFQSLCADVGKLVSRLDKLEGRTSGISAGWMLLGQIVAVVAALVAMFLSFG
jgi:hypothetical protein